MPLFPFSVYWWFYAAFALFVLGMLALDLGVFHRRAHEVSTSEALTWSAVWTAIALEIESPSDGEGIKEGRSSYGDRSNPWEPAIVILGQY